MLMKTHGLAADQLLTDLLALKERLNKAWRKGGFGSTGGSVCIVAGMGEIVRGHAQQNFADLSAVKRSEEDERVGRLTFSVYTAIYGEHAPVNITVSEAQSKIAAFNDNPTVCKETVMLAIDRAVAELLAPPVVSA